MNVCRAEQLHMAIAEAAGLLKCIVNALSVVRA
jgi:hypothetical protein